MVNPPTCDRAQGIALYLPQRPGAMRGGRNAHGGTVVLGVGLRTVPPQKQPPQIRHLAAEKRRQFRVCPALARKRPMVELGPDSALPDLPVGFQSPRQLLSAAFPSTEVPPDRSFQHRHKAPHDQENYESVL